MEGVAFYTVHADEVRGLMHPEIGGYRVKDIHFVAAFDVDERKVGKKLHEAISAEPNVTKRIVEPLHYSAIVHRGPTLDGVHKAMKWKFVKESSAPVVDVRRVLRESKTDILLNFVPSGGDEATYTYAQAALDAGCSFINCIPSRLAANPLWQKRFKEKNLVLLGDDAKSQLGATMLNRFLLALLKMRGICVTKSKQENHGGNADHYNLLYRAETKEKSKREALTKFLGKDDATPKVKFFYTGTPSGHKHVNITIEGEMFGRIPITITATIEDEISINGAGIVVDAIRMTKLLVDHGKSDEARFVSPFLMKSPSHPLSDTEAYEEFERYAALF